MWKNACALPPIAGLLVSGALLSGPTARPARAAVAVSNYTILYETCRPPFIMRYGDDPPPLVDNGVVDPDEEVIAAAVFTNIGASPTVHATATLEANANIIPLSDPGLIGRLGMGESVVRYFAFVAKGNCGDPFRLAINIRDGDNDIGQGVLNARLGERTVTYPTGINNVGIAIPATGPATPYPSSVGMGASGAVEGIQVTIKGLSHANPDDIDLLLVAPDGRKVLLMSDCGGSTDLSNVDLVFSSAATASLPDNAAITSGTYKPTNFGAGDVFQAPAPAGPYTADWSALVGVNPTGTWQLYLTDDAGGSAGTIDGWSLTLAVPRYDCCAGHLYPYPINTGHALVSESGGPSNGVIDPDETVSIRFTFRNIGNLAGADISTEVVRSPQVQPLAGPVPSGPLDIGAEDSATHPMIIRAPCGSVVPVILKVREGARDLYPVTYMVPVGKALYRDPDRMEFHDPASISIPSWKAATPYPSAISVADVWGSVARVRVRLENVTHPYPDNLDVLLVGPTGQTVMLMSDAGGGNPLDGVTLTFTDTAVLTLPDSNPIISTAYKPTNHELPDIFDAPAPVGPYGTALAAFNGLDPNGAWRLFVFDDTLGASGSIGGWSLILESGQSTFSYTAGPRSIPDRNTLDVPVPVEDYGYVSDLNVRVRLDHPWDADLEMSLVGPDGTEVFLARDRGGSGDNFGTGANDCTGIGTIFIDSAANPISAGTAPFAGQYRPENPLSAFAGKPMHGTWNLRIYDDNATNVGALGCWKLLLHRYPSREEVKTAGIVIPEQGWAIPSPSTIPVSGVPGRVVGVSVRLMGLTHANPDDLEIGLAGPDGQLTTLMNAAGGSNALTDVTMVFAQGAAGAPPDEGIITSGYYRPASYASAIGASTPANLSVFRGADPNGDWRLYIRDNRSGGSGSMAGWALTLHTTEYACPAGIPFTAADVQWAFGLACGTMSGTPASVGRLNVVTTGASAGCIDMADAACLARKVAGLEPNP